MDKKLTYPEVGAELGVHPYHVRRLVHKHPETLRPIVEGYNRIMFLFSDVIKLKKIRAREAVKARASAIKKLRKASRRLPENNS